MRACQKALGLLLAGLVLVPRAALAAQKVDLLLVLAADVSRSVDDKKFQLQRQGYIDALGDKRVLDAIRSGPNGRVGMAFVEWSGEGNERLVVKWAAIGDAASAKSFGDQLMEAPRSFADRTSISGGIDFAMTQLEHAPFQAARRTIDVSGDGTNNSGRDVAAARDEAVRKGVTINGLPILSENPAPWNEMHTNPPGGLEGYYRSNVVGGPGAFVMVATNFDSFGKAIVNKLIAEVSQADDKPPLRAAVR